MQKMIKVKSFRALARILSLAKDLRTNAEVKSLEMSNSGVTLLLEGDGVDELLKEVRAAFDDAHVEVIDKAESAPEHLEQPAEEEQPVAEQPADAQDEPSSKENE